MNVKAPCFTLSPAMNHVQLYIYKLEYRLQEFSKISIVNLNMDPLWYSYKVKQKVILQHTWIKCLKVIMKI